MVLVLPDLGAWAREGPGYQTSLMTQITRKLMRGTANVMCGWCEVPRNIHIQIEDKDPLTGVIVGTVRGVQQAAIRTGAGVWEIVTFPIPLPSEYRPLVEPEFVWMDQFGG
jgi:putative exosortase-associated protein (TIGR04073 family)